MPLRPLILRLQGKDEGATKKLNELTKKLNEARAPARRLDRAIRDFSKGTGLTALMTRMRSFGSLLWSLTKRMALFGAGLVTGLGIAVSKVIEVNDSLAKTAKRLGLTTDQMQELQLTFKADSVDASVLNAALRNLATRLGKAKVSGDQLLPTFMKIADRIKNAKSAQEKHNIAATYFGNRIGPQLINTMEGGSEALAQQAKMWHELGAIIGEDIIKASERADDALDRLKAIGTALSIRLLSSLVPTIDRLATGLTKWITENRKLIDSKILEFSGKLAGWIENLASNLPAMVTQMGQLANHLGTIVESIRFLTSFQGIPGSWGEFFTGHPGGTAGISRDVISRRQFGQAGVAPLQPPGGGDMTLTLRLVDPAGLLVGQGKGALKPGSELSVDLNLGKAMPAVP